MPEPISLFPAWLLTLRDATGYDLTPDKEVALMDAVHAMHLDEDAMMLTAESLVAKWPIKGSKRLDMTYRAWLRRELIRIQDRISEEDEKRARMAASIELARERIQRRA